MEPWDALSLVDLAVSLCSSLYRMFQTMKTNRVLCQDLAKKVQALQDLVRTINRSGRVPSAVCRALRALCENLDSAHSLMEKFSTISPMSGFLKSDKLKEKLLSVDKKLADSHQILQTALQIQHSRVLDKVYRTVRDQSSSSRSPLPDRQTWSSTSGAVVPSCSAPESPAAVAAVPFMVPMPTVMVPLVLPGAPTTSSYTTTTTTFVSRGVSPKALKTALALRPQINISQIFSAEQPALIGRCSLLPSEPGLNKISYY